MLGKNKLLYWFSYKRNSSQLPGIPPKGGGAHFLACNFMRQHWLEHINCWKRSLCFHKIAHHKAHIWSSHVASDSTMTHAALPKAFRINLKAYTHVYWEFRVQHINCNIFSHVLGGEASIWVGCVMWVDCWALILSKECSPCWSSLQRCCFVGTCIWRVAHFHLHGSPGIVLEDIHKHRQAADLKALLYHVYWLCSHCWQEYESLEAAEGFVTGSVALAHLQPRDAYTRGACLLLSTHLYSAQRHTVKSYTGGLTVQLCKGVKNWMKTNSCAHKQR